MTVVTYIHDRRRVTGEGATTLMWPGAEREAHKKTVVTFIQIHSFPTGKKKKVKERQRQRNTKAGFSSSTSSAAAASDTFSYS